MGVTNQGPEFLAKFPLGKVPAFEGADGFCLTEGAAIATYIAASGPKSAQLIGSDLKTKAQVAQWTLFTDGELVTHMTPSLVMCVAKFAPWDEARYDFAASQFERAVRRVEAGLEDGGKYLVGESLTLADLMVAAVLFTASGFLFDAEMRKGVPKTVAYLESIAAIPEFKAAFGDLKMCETRAGKP